MHREHVVPGANGVREGSYERLPCTVSIFALLSYTGGQVRIHDGASTWQREVSLGPGFSL
jgi:hypothetical protein